MFLVYHRVSWLQLSDGPHMCAGTTVGRDIGPDPVRRSTHWQSLGALWGSLYGKCDHPAKSILLSFTTPSGFPPAAPSTTVWGIARTLQLRPNFRDWRDSKDGKPQVPPGLKIYYPFIAVSQQVDEIVFQIMAETEIMEHASQSGERRSVQWN